MEEIRKQSIIFMAVTTALLTLTVGGSNFILFQFKEVFNGFGGDLPVVTKVVSSTYYAWWILPIIQGCMLAVLYLKKSSVLGVYAAYCNAASFGAIIVSIVFVVLSGLAIFLPIVSYA